MKASMAVLFAPAPMFAVMRANLTLTASSSNFGGVHHAQTVFACHANCCEQGLFACGESYCVDSCVD